MRSIRFRPLLALSLIGLGVAVVAIYFGQINRSAPLTPATPQYYGPLVPTAIGKAASPQNRSTTTLLAALDASLLSDPIGEATSTPLSQSANAAIVTRTPLSRAKATLTPPAKRSITPVQKKSTPTPTTGTASAAQRDLQSRVCVSIPMSKWRASGLDQLRPGWYLDWRVNAHPARPNNVEYAQMVRVPQGQPTPNLKTLGEIARQNPGALWLVGNEMDVIWQDNATPEQYAAAYHDVYATLKQADPSSRVAIGGISEPSPLRLQYLDRILQVYRDRYGQEMPIDVWNVHNFILPEQRGSWGVDIPPGSEATSGVTYSIDDHGRLDLFKQQLVDFRRWMAEHGYRDKELLVTEYGILMPTEYGYDYPRVHDFLLGTFDYMRTATDPALGQPADGNRLVQRWCWYSLADTTYPTGNFMDPAKGQLTPLGRDLQRYLTTSP